MSRLLPVSRSEFIRRLRYLGSRSFSWQTASAHEKRCDINHHSKSSWWRDKRRFAFRDLEESQDRSRGMVFGGLKGSLQRSDNWLLADDMVQTGLPLGPAQAALSTSAPAGSLPLISSSSMALNTPAAGGPRDRGRRSWSRRHARRAEISSCSDISGMGAVIDRTRSKFKFF